MSFTQVMAAYGIGVLSWQIGGLAARLYMRYRSRRGGCG